MKVLNEMKYLKTPYDFANLQDIKLDNLHIDQNDDDMNDSKENECEGKDPCVILVRSQALRLTT